MKMERLMPRAPARQESALHPGFSCTSKMLHPWVCAEQYLIHPWVPCSHSCGDHLTPGPAVSSCSLMALASLGPPAPCSGVQQ